MTSPTAWAHLPNAAHIDKVLASLEAHPKKWDTAWSAARGAAWSAARSVARGTVWGAARGAARDAAWDAAWGAARGAVRDTALGTAWDAIAALIAYDDAGRFMKLPTEQLKAMYRLDPHPMYLLLQPATVIFVET